MQGSRDFQRTFFFVEVLPLQTADLAAAQSGSQFRVEEIVPGFIRFDGLHEDIHLLIGQDLFRLLTAFRHRGALCRILMDQMLLLCDIHCKMQHGVYTSYGGVRELFAEFRVFVNAALFFQLDIHSLHIGSRDLRDTLMTEDGANVLLCICPR